MAKYIIQGGNKLRGSVRIGGNKNSILPALSATLLTEEEVILKNVPRIADVLVFLEVFSYLGVNYSWIDENILSIKATSILKTDIPKELMKKLRASILFSGSLGARMGKVEIHHPGGDIIGKRSLGTHFQGLISLGFSVRQDDLVYKIKREKRPQFVEIFQEEASVTGTENTILAAALGETEIILKNCPQEPHVIDLCNMLNSMGAKIEGVGTHTLKIKGISKLSGTEFTIGQDFVELGTYAIAAAITGGKITLMNCTLEGMEPVINPLLKMGIKFGKNNQGIEVWSDRLKSISKLHTNIWPGFPSDFMSPVILLATQSEGISLLHDWMYESRMFFVDKLISMGANITIADPHRVLVYGPTKFYGRELESPDIRAGMTLLLAALIAKGQSVINRAELVERGYERVVENLTELGADIKKVD